MTKELELFRIVIVAGMLSGTMATAMAQGSQPPQTAPSQSALRGPPVGNDEGGVPPSSVEAAGPPIDEPPRCDGCFAFVSSPGGLLRNKQAVSATRLSTGQYEVRFRFRIIGCAWLGNGARADFNSSSIDTMIAVTGRARTIDGVFVQTWDTNGVRADRPFNVRIAC